MLTKWGKKAVAVATASAYIIPYLSTGQVTSGIPGMIQAKSITGKDLFICFAPTSQQLIANPAALVESGVTVVAGIAFGSGTTPPTENDYTLEHQITGFTATSPSTVPFYDTTNFKYIARTDFSVSNDTGSSITISEVGQFASFYVAPTRGSNTVSGGSNKYLVLIDRTVLSQPITIPNGSAATVRYDFVYDA